MHEFSGITVNNGEKDRFWIGFRELILADRSFILLIPQVSNMAELIAAADLSLCAGGATMWERYFLGLPSITVIFADNQE